MTSREAETLEQQVKEHERLVRSLREKEYGPKTARAAGLIASCLRKNRKLLLCGNGGSASDCQHFAGEMVGRFLKERKGLPCISLTTDTSILTSIGNDYSFEKVFSRQVEALGRPGDVLAAFSTSGKSQNILAAALTGKNMGLGIISFTGRTPNPLADAADVCLSVASDSTPRIQEIHILLIHLICLLVEETL